MKFIAPVFAFSALVLGTASAQDSPLAKPLRKYDANNDGKLTGEELVQARQAFNRGGKALDNGGRSSREFAERRRRSWQEQNMKFLDLNGNGTLEEAENKRATTIWEAISAEQDKMRSELLRKYDKNDDGELNDEERRAWWGEFEAKRREIEKRVMDAHPKPAAAGS